MMHQRCEPGSNPAVKMCPADLFSSVIYEERQDGFYRPNKETAMLVAGCHQVKRDHIPVHYGFVFYWLT